MKKTLLPALLMLFLHTAFAQQYRLDEVSNQRQQINKKGFLIIGSWSAANIIYGSVASSGTHGSTSYFHRMNAIWNGVTLGLATFGYLSSKKETGLSLAQTLQKQGAAEKIFLFNAGLDVAYVLGGLYLKEKSKSASKNAEREKGYGESIMLQGGVLFLFDALMYGVHAHNGKRLFRIADNVKLDFNGKGVGIFVKI